MPGDKDASEFGADSHKAHRNSKAGRKAERRKHKKTDDEGEHKKHGDAGEDRAKAQARNPKAFALYSGVRAERQNRRRLDVQAKKHHIPVLDRTPVDPPPILVGVIGPPRSGKTTLIRSLVRQYTRHKLTDTTGPITVVSGKARRLTFVECDGVDLNAMIDVAKTADLVLLLVDASFGFEMESFEALNVMQVHGFPRIMGVLTHLDHFKDNKRLRKTKKRFKTRFWTEIYQGAKLFYLSGLVDGLYGQREVFNLCRFISVMKFRPLQWRNSHPYVIADRFEDISDPERVRRDPKADRNVSMYGFVRGTNLKTAMKVHVAGCGDFFMENVTIMEDPVPLPSRNGQVKRRKLDDKKRALYAPMANVGDILYDKDAVYIDLPEELVQRRREEDALVREAEAERALEEEGEEAEGDGDHNFRGMAHTSAGGVGEQMLDSLVQQEATLDAQLDESEMRLFSHTAPLRSSEVESVFDLPRARKREERVVVQGGRVRRRAIFDDDESGEEDGNDDEEDNDEEDDDDDEEEEEEEEEEDEEGEDEDERPKRTLAGGKTKKKVKEKKKEKETKKERLVFEVEERGGKMLGSESDDEEFDEDDEMEMEMSDDDDDDEFDEEAYEMGSDDGNDDDDDDDEDEFDEEFDESDSDDFESDSEPDSESDSDEETSALRWKTDLQARAAESFGGNRPVNLARLIYGKHGSDETAATKKEAKSKESKKELFGGLFRKAHSHNVDEEASAEEDDDDEDEADANGSHAVTLPEEETCRWKVQKELLSRWENKDVLETLRGRFVTGKWDEGRDAATLLARDGEALKQIKDMKRRGRSSAAMDAGGGDDDDDDDDDEVYGDFEDLETGEVHRAGNHDEDDGDVNMEDADEMEAERRKWAEKKAAAKRKFDAAFDAGGIESVDGLARGTIGGDEDDMDEDDEEGTGGDDADGIKRATKDLDRNKNRDDDDYYQGLKRELEERRERNEREWADDDDLTRVQYEGVRPGHYVRIELRGVPCELVTHFNPRCPLLLGGLLHSEETLGFVQARFKKHRWHKKILKTNDPLIMSVGWRRYQTLPVYTITDHNMRNRMLKYTPQHMHCVATFYGPLVAPGAGVLALQSVATQQPGFRIAGTGVITELDQSFTIVKKLKLTGVPYKIFKRTAFIKDMFSTQLEVAKFEGASIRTVSGVRGQVKRALAAPEGAYRAAFEDKVLASDIVFMRTWYPVVPTKYHNPVTNLLLGERWQGMRTTAQLRRDNEVAIPKKKDSEYTGPIERPVRRFNPLKVPKNIQLPFASAPKLATKRQRPTLATRRAVVMEPQERKVYALMQRINTVRNERVRLRKEKSRESHEKHKKKLAEVEVRREQARKKNRKAYFETVGARTGGGKGKGAHE